MTGLFGSVMQSKELLRQKFEACLHRGDTYTERDFQMWCAGYAQGFIDGYRAQRELAKTAAEIGKGM